jgi:Ca-activated chloride channel family protein
MTRSRHGAIVFGVLFLMGCGEGGAGASLWWTPDQLGDRLLASEDAEGAATVYRDPMRRGVALYRAGSFGEAAASFGRVDTPEAHYDRGNALLMAGQYLDAIAAYERCLEDRPGWSEASDNLALAHARQARFDTAAEERTDQGTNVGADKVVSDDTPPPEGRDGKEQVVEAGLGNAVSDEGLQQAWLRRVASEPRDFLRARFAWDVAEREAEPEAGDDAR